MKRVLIVAAAAMLLGAAPSSTIDLRTVEVAGASLGQNCSEARGRFSSEDRWDRHAAAQGYFSRGDESVLIACVETTRGKEVSGIVYSTTTRLVSREEMIALTQRRFGTSYARKTGSSGEDVRGWGDSSWRTGTPGRRYDNPLSARGAYALYTYNPNRRETFGGIGHEVVLSAGKDWEEAQLLAVETANRERARQTYSPAF